MIQDSIVIRRLWPHDIPAFRRHLQRLDAETRRARFGSPVTDQFLDRYAATAHNVGTIVYGGFAGSDIVAAAELRPLGHVGDAIAEAAFTVEVAVQHRGIGSKLMERIITAAQNRRIGQLYMICLRDNDHMRQLAGKFGARLKVAAGEVTGEIDPPWPTPASLFDETVLDATGFVTAVLNWPVYPAIAAPGTQT